MQQHEITQKGALLDETGMLREPGWSRRMLLQYQRESIRAATFKIKEWDYYLVTDGRYGIALTIADNGYMALISASMLDFVSPWEHTATVIKPFTMGKLRLPHNSEEGDVRFSQKGLHMEFQKSSGARRLQLEWADFYEGKPFTLDIALEEPAMDSIVIATPFTKPGRFYYNQKINCMPASGSASLGERALRFSPKTAFGTLDWGRGVWTYDNTWYWGSGSGMLQGKPFGFNIGYGFGDTSAATENVLFFDGRAHKLEEVTFHIPQGNFMAPWTFSSSDSRFEMDFTPVLDRAAHMNVLVLESDQHQVFGRFCGKAVLDDGSILQLQDFFGFAEKVRNRY